MLIIAVLFKGLIATPQLKHVPPEKDALALLLLFTVVVRVVPVIKYTAVVFAVQTD